MIIDSAKISIQHKLLSNYSIKSEDICVNNEAGVFLLPAKIKIEFTPHGLKPLLRINDILVNYWLADVTQYDHMLEFTISNDFWVKYYNKETQNQINFANTNYKNDPMAIDKYVGIFDSSNLIKIIRDNLIG